MTLDLWPWAYGAVGLLAGLAIGIVRLREHRRLLAMHLDATDTVLHAMLDAGVTEAPITGVQAALGSIREECL